MKPISNVFGVVSRRSAEVRLTEKGFPDLRQGKRGRRRRKPGDPHKRPGAKADHPWQYEHSAPRKPKKFAGVDWWTGEPLPNTLDFWVRSAIKGRRGVVLDAAKTRELARLLGIPTEPSEDESAHRPVPDGEVATGADLVDPDPAVLEGADGVLSAQLELPFGPDGEDDQQE